MSSLVTTTPVSFQAFQLLQTSPEGNSNLPSNYGTIDLKSIKQSALSLKNLVRNLKDMNIIKNLVAGDIAIDLGTANTLVWIKGQGIVLNEPSIVAKNTVTNEIIAVGNEAKEMVGRTHSGIETIRPLKDGVISDDKMTDAMIQGFIRKINLS